MAQINVRIGQDAKIRGDAGLATLGISPSHIVRMVWDALSTPEGAQRIAQALNIMPAQPKATTPKVAPPLITQKEAALDHLFRSFEAFGQEHDLDLNLLPNNSFEDIRANVMQEKLAHWQEGDEL